ncbi:MAG: hypothetical protein AB2813_00680 [Candidatus Sedimenticola endophacoides]
MAATTMNKIEILSVLPLLLARSIPGTLADIVECLGRDFVSWNIIHSRSFPHIYSTRCEDLHLARMDVRLESDESINFITIEPDQFVSLSDLKEAIGLEPTHQGLLMLHFPPSDEHFVRYCLGDQREVHLIYDGNTNEVLRILVKHTPTQVSLPNYDPITSVSAAV